jgi:uncharacterized membrane protein
MSKVRLEAFSDAVIAIIMTIMVLELKVPDGTDLAALQPRASVFAAYLLSFVNLGIYWTNHHHMLHVTRQVNGAVLWANLHLLFWLSLFPFTTAWIGENRVASLPTASYGVVGLLAAIAYYLLQGRIVALEGPDSTLARAIGRDRKGKLSPLLYALAIVLAFVQPWLAIALYVTVALIWLVPDPRVERLIGETPHEPGAEPDA